MRNAERFLAQGKLRAAIGEYKQVVRHFPKDIATLNMLGDLYVKDNDSKAAVNCFTQVAEHYSGQGFSQKAIAVYNKISKLQPNSVEVSAKLAQLYQGKGSLSEARSHYTTLARHYQLHGRMTEALAIWKQIALLDPNNTEVYLNLAEAFLQEGQTDEAVESLVEAGLRFAKLREHASAVNAFGRALEVKPCEVKTLTAFLQSKKELGKPGEAAKPLEGAIGIAPYNREILHLLIECYLESGRAVDAEKTVVRLVELEPSTYPKTLDLVRIYIDKEDAGAAVRMLKMSAEHLLAAGKAEELHLWIDEILKLDGDQHDAIKLLVRCTAWQQDEKGFKDALVMMADVAAANQIIDDERFALVQLASLSPGENTFSERLEAFNNKNGISETGVDEQLLDKLYHKQDEQAVAVQFENFTLPSYEEDERQDTSSNGLGEIEVSANSITVAGNEALPPAEENFANQLPLSSELKLEKELESIKYYLENGYLDLAEKFIQELKTEFGDRNELAKLQKQLAEASESKQVDQTSESIETAFDLSNFRTELGFEETEPADDDDYETHYHIGIAYQEMGLNEEAIKQYQDAINQVTPNDGTRRFFQCANLLGHCFMASDMAHLALIWYKRALETNELTEEEKQAVWYELAAAYESDGNTEKAAEYFQKVYAENVDFRDVGERMKNLMVGH